MATIVIVHGMFDGGWSWRGVKGLLEGAGHRVYTATLTGLGERVHLAHPEIDLETHIADIVNLLYFEDLADVRLVGHSYAGCVITGVADRARERLASLIYLDAHVPDDGESFLQLLDANNRAGIEAATRTSGEGWRVPPPAAPSDPGVESHPTSDLWAWFHPRLVPHPFKTLTQPLRLTRPPDETLSRAYHLLRQQGGMARRWSHGWSAFARTQPGAGARSTPIISRMSPRQRRSPMRYWS